MINSVIGALLGAAALLPWTTGAQAHESAGGSPQAKDAVVTNHFPAHPMALLEAKEGNWSVSRTDVGCFLISAVRKKASRLALGRNAAGLLGLYVIDLALTTPGQDTAEAVELRLGDTDLPFAGRVIGNRLLFVQLNPEQFDRSLRTLTDSGILWLGVRGAWLSHGGQNLPAMVAEYGRQCAAPPKAPVSTPVASGATSSATIGAGGTPAASPLTAKVGSKAASAP